MPTLYDDGGFSGGNAERPALKRLIADIEAGKIDVVVVYKVDRLTRALSDFAKLVEVFDRRGVSFVSITQQFNTTTSMGRLTLNVLLSFAQFEREVTGERIRDKIAASKKKGMWMGGFPSLGYDVQDRKLVVNDNEARTVLHIFQRYLQLKSVRALQAELDEAAMNPPPPPPFFPPPPLFFFFLFEQKNLNPTFGGFPPHPKNNLPPRFFTRDSPPFFKEGKICFFPSLPRRKEKGDPPHK